MPGSRPKRNSEKHTAQEFDTTNRATPQSRAFLYPLRIALQYSTPPPSRHQARPILNNSLILHTPSQV